MRGKKEKNRHSNCNEGPCEGRHEEKDLSEIPEIRHRPENDEGEELKQDGEGEEGGRDGGRRELAGSDLDETIGSWKD